MRNEYLMKNKTGWVFLHLEIIKNHKMGELK